MEIRDRIKELRRVKASELLPNPKNWRQHPKSQVNALTGVLNQIGYADALIARETPEGLMLIDGHLRTEITPDMKVPVLVVDLTEEEADLMLATFDPLAGMAESDNDLLANLLQSIKTDDENIQTLLQSIGEDYEALPPIPGDPIIEVPAQIDKADELNEKWKCKPGQLWKIGNHRLLCGDGTADADVERLMDKKKSDMVFTDPPYGVNVSGAGGKALCGDLSFTLIPFIFDSIDVVLKPGGAVYMCGGSSNVDLYFKLYEKYMRMQPHIIVWVKEGFVLRRHHYHSKYELIFFGWKPGAATIWAGDRKQTDVWEVSREKHFEHPTIKPIELCSKAITNSSQKGMICFDPFLGSGSTMVASEQTDRICYGMEIEPKYCAVTLERMSDMGLIPELLGG